MNKQIILVDKKNKLQEIEKPFNVINDVYVLINFRSIYSKGSIRILLEWYNKKLSKINKALADCLCIVELEYEI